MVTKNLWLPTFFKISYFYIPQKKETHLSLEQHEGSDGDNFFLVNYRFNVLIILCLYSIKALNNYFCIITRANSIWW